MTIPHILIHQINYSIHETFLFSSLSLSLGKEKTGLVGRNGIGKTSLLRLIMGEIKPQSGTIQVSGKLAYCPQLLHIDERESVAQVLGVQEKLLALSRVKEGSLNEEDYLIIGDDWDLNERIQHYFTLLNLTDLTLHSLAAQLSGGEKTRLSFAKALLTSPHYIILDEPTNNLDFASRNALYQTITQYQSGLLIVSHDRTLLNLMEQTIELTSLGVNLYGGNYDYYEEQKILQQRAAERELLDAKKEFVKTKNSYQLTKEKNEQKSSRGRQLFLNGKIDRLSANSKRGRSERTQSRLAKQSDNAIHQAAQQIEEAKSKIEIVKQIDITLPATFVPNGKLLLNIEQLSFAYPEQAQPIIHAFNFSMTGPERIALIGNNGSGKTTLVKLMLGNFIANEGHIYRGTERIRYLDQTLSLLNPNLTLLDNFLLMNPDANTNEAHATLAKFLFKNKTALKLVKQLSGGERIHAALACVLMAKVAPQLLILDEPTNHLDLESILQLETALNCYQGALLVISHDASFLKKIRTTRTLSAPFFITN